VKREQLMLAAELNCRDEGSVMSREKREFAKKHNLIVMYLIIDGDSTIQRYPTPEINKIVKIDGLFQEEFCNPLMVEFLNGIPLRFDMNFFSGYDVTKQGFRRLCGDCGVEYSWHEIIAIGDYVNNMWVFETSVPHDKFFLCRNSKPYCKGIVIDQADLMKKPKRITTWVAGALEFRKRLQL